MRNKAGKIIDETITWKEITPGGIVYEAGSAENFKTGAWRTMRVELIQDKCIHCLLCAPVCPDSAIPVKNGKRLDFDFDHCKGCGICYSVCPVKAIKFIKE